MPGTVVFKPIEANITHNTERLGKMDPYCLFHVGTQKIKGQVCKKGGKHPQWEDSIVIPITNQPTCMVDLKDKDLFHDDKIGTFEVDLREVETQGRLKKWYPLFYKEKPAGEILVEAIYAGDTTTGASQGLINSTALPTNNFVGGIAPTTIQQETTSTIIAGQPVMIDQTVGASYVVNEGITTSNFVSGTNYIGGAPLGGIPMMGGDIPVSGIYGSQGLNSLQGDNVLPVVGGSFPSTHSGIMNATHGNSDLYAQEALLRGVDPLNVQSINRHNANQGLGYSGVAPNSQLGNRFGGL